MLPAMLRNMIGACTCVAVDKLSSTDLRGISISIICWFSASPSGKQTFPTKKRRCGKERSIHASKRVIRDMYNMENLS